MTERNPDRDWDIIRARCEVLEAQGKLEERPGSYQALEVQYRKRKWDAMKQLTLVRK